MGGQVAFQQPNASTFNTPTAQVGAFWTPVESVAAYLPGLQELIINQVHYYLSPENLSHDDFLRSHMDPQEAWLSIKLLSTFNRLLHV